MTFHPLRSRRRPTHAEPASGYPKRRRAPKLGPTEPAWRGWEMPGGGRTPIVDAAPEWRGPSVQVAGLYPFSAGASLPMTGAPLGPHLHQRGVVCADPVSWFAAGLINNPSAFVLGRPGLGKSSLVCRILIMLAVKGLIPMVLSDVKGEYAPLIRGLDGQVIRPQRGAAYVNPLDRGPLWPLLATLPEQLRGAAEADIDARRLNVLYGLCELALVRQLRAHERNALSQALQLWESRHPGETPVLPDLLDVVLERPDELTQVVHDRGDPDRYFDRLEGVVDALTSLAGNGEFGDIFAHHTSVTIEMHRPLCVDLSWVDEQDTRLQAGLQLVMWSIGSGAVAAAKFAAEAGVAPRRSYLMVMDELWRSLKAADFMVYRVDEITRLNRTLNLAQILCTHTMDDLKLTTAEATEKAFGFVSRSEMVFMGGLAPKEMGNLRQVFAITEQEQKQLEAWSPPGETNPDTGTSDPPPGRGKFMLKVGQQIGTPFSVLLSQLEIDVHDTNANWRDTIESLNRTRPVGGDA